MERYAEILPAVKSIPRFANHQERGEVRFAARVDQTPESNIDENILQEYRSQYPVRHPAEDVEEADTQLPSDETNALILSLLARPLTN